MAGLVTWFLNITSLSDDVNWLVISRVEIFILSSGKCCFQVQTKIINLVVLQTVSSNKQQLYLPQQFNYNGEPGIMTSQNY